MQQYADIVVPIARGPFTFHIGDRADELTPGTGVEVEIGSRKRYMGIVWRLHDDKPKFATKAVGRTMTCVPLLNAMQMRFWEWIASYYMCTLGDVMRFALPSALKPSGLSEEELRSDEYRPATVSHIRLGSAVRNAEALHAACESLKRSKAQYKALMELCSHFDDGGLSGGSLPRSELSASSQIIKKLVDKGIIETYDEEAAVLAATREHRQKYETATLTPAQDKALDEIRHSFDTRECTLLQGVTGSGKTEIYMHLIADMLAGGRSVLYMMPEIAMTSQLVARIRAVFGHRVTVYHSKMSDRHRAEVYRRLLASDGGELVLGVRSAIFLPLPSPGLIIVDEEHDASYKQSDPAPRYNARDCAVWLAHASGARCLLASATPSIESYVNATGGKYGFVTLNERYGSALLPRITISDSLRAFKRGERRLHFDKALLDRMAATLARGRQVMLFQNRRGFAPWVECPQCSWVAKCPRCSVTLTYHKQGGRMQCHVCGYSSTAPAVCPKCGTPSPRMLGLGTEKVEEETATLFPDARILRLDRDTATSTSRYEHTVTDFERGAADILVGTQMITKGFDFPGLELVGILNADNMLNFPDFRASERAYQTMTQVAGRAGRSGPDGEVVIQTSQPDHPVIRQVQTLDYEGMVNMQLAERSIFGYPPYGRLIKIIMRHRDERLLNETAAWLAARTRELFGNRVFGPHAPLIEKAGGESFMEIMLKIENGTSAAKVKERLAKIISAASRHANYKRVTVFCDIDPQ